MTFDEIPIRMLQLGVDRAWLCEKCDYKPGTLAAILAPNGNLKSKTDKALRRIWEALDREEERQKAAIKMPEPLGYRVFIEPTEEQFDRWMQAVYQKPGRTFDSWAKAGLEVLANEELGKRQSSSANTVPMPTKPSDSESFITFPEIPLFHAAAGSPISADGDTYAPTRDHGTGRFACRLHGESMSPRFPDGSTVILRSKDSLKKPVLKRHEIYLFDIGGEKTLKLYSTRPATKDEIKSGASYPSTKDGKPKVRVLRAINPDFPEIVLRPNDRPDWIGWLDPKDAQ